MKSSWSRFTVAAVLVLLLSACGSGSSSEVVAASTEAEPDPTSASADATAAEPEASSDGPETLDDYLGAAANLLRAGGGGGPGGAGGGGGFDQDQALEQQRLVQQQIQLCMQNEGFVYVQEEVGDGLRFLLATQQSGQTAAEYAESEGFGISTAFDALLDGDVDVTETVSPNDEHVATLSEGEADAWQFALRGARPERNEQGQLIDPETGEVVQGRQAAGGCTGDANIAVRGDVELLAELAQDFDELEERIAADPRIAEVARNWTDCMGAAGFDYQDEAEARAELNDEFRPLLRSFFGAQNQGDGDDGADGDGDGDGGQGQGGGGGNRLQAISGVQLTADQELELQALQERERSIAVAAVGCESGSEIEVAEIVAGYEAEFIETNRAALDAISS